MTVMGMQALHQVQTTFETSTSTSSLLTMVKWTCTQPCCQPCSQDRPQLQGLDISCFLSTAVLIYVTNRSSNYSQRSLVRLSLVVECTCAPMSSKRSALRFSLSRKLMTNLCPLSRMFPSHLRLMVISLCSLYSLTMYEVTKRNLRGSSPHSEKMLYLCLNYHLRSCYDTGKIYI